MSRDSLTNDELYEHQVYLNVLESFKRAKAKRKSYKKYGSMTVVISALVFMALIFSTDSKATFLCLWIATILYTIALMIRAEYKYYRLKLWNGYIVLSEVTYAENSNDEKEIDLLSTKNDNKVYLHLKSVINQEPSANELTIYTTSDGSIKILINDEEIITIQNPNIPSFEIVPVANVSYGDQEAGNPVTVTYEFKEFQLSK